MITLPVGVCDVVKSPTCSLYCHRDSFEIIRKFSSHPSILKIRSSINDGSTFEFSHIHPWDTYQVIMGLNTKKSTSGSLPTHILQYVAKECSVPLTDCFNNCILDGVFPTELKLAHVIPVFKSGEASSKLNYRPISILPSLSKVFEKLLFLQINSFFKNKFSSLLCGFRANHSTQKALFLLLQKWQSCLDTSGKIGTILMDLSKAFDCLPHALLLAKLEAYGFTLNSLKLMMNYLGGRFQRVKIGSTLSKWLEVLLGVPQGSILGPLLFNIFINDFFLFMTRTDVCNFADDNTIYSCASTADVVISDLEIDLRISLNWFHANQLVANPSKFKLMFLGMKEGNLTLFIDNNLIMPSKSVKLLGITIDKELKFDLHIDNICKQANKKVCCLYRIRRFLNVDNAQRLCNAFVLSNFNYCPLIWMFCNKTLDGKINTVHKRALRAVTRDYNNSLEELISSVRGLKIHQRNLQTLLTEMYKCIVDVSASAIDRSLFPSKGTPYYLRTSILVSLPPTKSIRFGTNSILFRGSQLWNSLPDSIKKCGSLSLFKKNVASWAGSKCLCPLCKV